MMDHNCPKPAMGEPREVFVIDRPRLTAQTMCTGCGLRWDNDDGEREFVIWGIGYVAGKRDAVGVASWIPEPDTPGWPTTVTKSESAE